MRAYLIATAILAVARVWIHILRTHDGIPGALGAATGLLVWGLIPAAIYWFMKGRRLQDGKARTAKVMFWWALIAPLIAQSLPKNT
jgi:NAD-specific glutamate dehydrogenase